MLMATRSPASSKADPPLANASNYGRVDHVMCQQQGKSKPWGSAKCCHNVNGVMSASACASILAAALITELAVARMLWPARAKFP